MGHEYVWLLSKKVFQMNSIFLGGEMDFQIIKFSLKELRIRKRGQWGKLVNALMILATLFSMMNLPLLLPVHAEGEYNWIAYNDCAGTTSGNNTNYTVTSGSTTGYLKDYNSGEDVAASVTFSASQTMPVRTTSGAFPSSGTDAYTTFNGYANMAGVISYGDEGYYVDMTFDGLDPSKLYMFATSANRNDTRYTSRISKFTISGIDAATNASTDGVTVNSNESVAFSTGDNIDEGYVARWTGIQPGSDGAFVVRVEEQTAGNQGYGPSVFMLAEEASTDPVITVSEAMEAFSSEPGEYSDIQSYSVSGANLEGDITITPPVDFEISLTGVDGWVANPSTIVLSPDGEGAVTATDIYIRFYRSDEGTSSGNITHTSTNATQIDVGVTGTASTPMSGWVAYNDCAWASGQLNTNITLYTIPSGGTASGLLVDYTTGEDTPVTATITASGSPSIQTGTYGGSETDAGTDAYEAFHGFVDMPGVVQYGGSSGWWVEVTFTDLDPENTYAFVTSANRDGDYTDRFTKFTLLDADAASNTSSSGVTISTTTFADDTTVFNTGENTSEGYVASWEEIDPGEDGDFTVRAECNSSPPSYKAYAFSVFKLAEEAPVGPRITTSVDTLSAFSAAPGQLSSAQTYTVSGENLTEDINIAAPSGFLLSLDDYEYNAFLTLTQAAGIVVDTTVYVALYSDTEGVFSGDIIHSSAGAATKSVAVSGEASSTFETSFQQDINGYAGTEDTFVMENNPNTAYGDEDWVEWDADDPYGSGKENTGLLKFDDIFGTGAGQISLGSTILEATLTITINDSGDDATVNEVISAWSETTTYNGFGSTAGVQAEDYGDVTGTASGASTGAISLDVTDSVQGWSNGETNLGWIFRPSGDGGVEFRSSEFATVSQRPLLEVTYYVGEVNDPPNTPILVQPADDAFDVSIPPTLEVTVSDPESDLMDVSFYGRPVGTGSGEDFLFIAVPDTQMLAQSYPGVMLSQFQWIASQTITFVTSLGDIVNSSSTISQWDAADSAYDELDSAGKAYSVGPGNHDIAYGTTYYPDYFGSARFTGKSWYQGYYTGGSDNYNNYSFFSASGMDFIVINLQYNATTAQQEWADSLLKAYPERQGIVVQHDILNTNNTWANQASFNSLKDNPNLFLMLCGHMHSGSDGSAYRAELGDDGHTIHILLTDYQDLSNSDNLRLLTFKPAEDAIFAQIYSPQGDSYLTNASNYEEFTMAYEMSGSEPFELIGTVEDMGDGNVSISWPGLANETEYEWYAEVTDGTSATVSSTWSFTTQAVNNPPVVGDIPDQSVAEGGSFTTINLDDFVEDVEDIDSDISWSSSGNLDLTVSIVDRVATIGIPSSEWVGEETISFTAEDLDGATDSDSATFTVTPVNDPPVVGDIPNQTIAEGESFTAINLDDYVEDVEDEDSDISWTFSGNIELIVSIVDRVATISVPNADWNGTETITFTAEDLDGGMDDDSASFTVTPINDAPVVSDIPGETIVEGETFATINLDDYVNDVDNPDADITWTTSGEVDLTVNIVDRVATIIIPDADWNGTETITFTAEDLNGATDSDSATFTITPVNDAPVVGDIPGETIAEGEAFATINLDDYVSDMDNSDTDISWTISGEVELTVSIVDRVATISVPDADWNGTETITFTATDLGLATDSDSATFTVTPVNDAPVVGDIPGETIVEGETFATINLDDYVTDVDDPDADITWTTSGEVDLTVNIVDRVATIIIPDADWNGTETITFTAEDLGLATDSDSATFTVTAVNDAPVVGDIPGETIVEGGSFATINLDDYVSDVDNSDTDISWTTSGEVDLTVSIVDRVATISVPDADWNGTETITFTATDLGLATDSDSATFTVTPVNDAPVVSDIPDQTIAEGETFAKINLDDYVNDVDNPDTDISWTTSGEVDLTVNIVDRVATISVPDADWNGTETITFTATDTHLATDSDDATFTVTAVNDPPVVSDIPDQTIAEGETFVTINLDDYVADVEDADAAILWSTTGESDLTVDITGRVATIGIPSSDWNGTETITFTATDTDLATDSDDATFTVTAVNDAPVVSDIPGETIAEGETFATINLDDYVNDVDNPDADIIWTTSGEVDLIVSIVDRVATISVPNADWNGTETITFTSEDPIGATDSDSATFTITAVNDAPVVSDIPGETIAEGEAFATINLDDYVSDVDNLDTDISWTISGEVELTVSIVDRVATITIPNVDWNGSETITFTATDTNLATDSDDATFTVNAVNDPPVVSDIPDQTIEEGETFLTINLDAYVTDVEDADSDIIWTAAGETDLVVEITDRVATITIPNVDWNGSETITFTATDTDLAADCDDATFTVTAINDAPILDYIGDKGVDELIELAFTAAASDPELPVQTLSFSLENCSAGDVPTGAAITSGGEFSWTPTEEQGPNDYTFEICVSDGELDDCETITVTVAEVNEAPELNPVGNQDINEGELLVFVASASDPDYPEQDLTFSIADGATGEVPLGAVMTEGSDFGWIPSELQGPGVYTFDVCVSDGLLPDCETITVTVNEVNEAPELDAIGDKGVEEGSTLAFTATAADPDLPVQILTFTLEDGLSGEVPLGASITAGGAFSWTPTEEQAPGDYTFNICVSDGEDTTCETITVTVSEYEPKACYVLTIGHTGDGSDPTPDLANSKGCEPGTYEPGETINLSGATAADGWHIASWYGTEDDSSTGNTNVVIMPEGDTEVGVDYETTVFLPMFLGPNN